MTKPHDEDASAGPQEFLLGDFGWGKLFHFEVYGDHPTDPTTATMYAESSGTFFHILKVWNADEIGTGTTLRSEWIKESGFDPRTGIGSLLYGETIRILQQTRKRRLAAEEAAAA